MITYTLTIMAHRHTHSFNTCCSVQGDIEIDDDQELFIIPTRRAAVMLSAALTAVLITTVIFTQTAMLSVALTAIITSALTATLQVNFLFAIISILF